MSQFNSMQDLEGARTVQAWGNGGEGYWREQSRGKERSVKGMKYKLSVLGLPRGGRKHIFVWLRRLTQGRPHHQGGACT